MRKTIFAAVPLAVLALAAPAAAHGGRATTYKADVVAVAAAPSDGATAAKAVPGIRGQAKLVDGSRRDKVQLKVKGLVAGGAYVWSVRSSADGDACNGTEVDAFSYGPLTARRHGNTSARSRSVSFSAVDGTSYAVVVTSADGTDVACGEFMSKADRRAAKAKRKAERRAAGRKAHGNGGDKATGHDQSADDPSDD